MTHVTNVFPVPEPLEIRRLFDMRLGLTFRLGATDEKSGNAPFDDNETIMVNGDVAFSYTFYMFVYVCLLVQSGYRRSNRQMH